MSNQRTREEYIEKATLAHGGIYDYSRVPGKIVASKKIEYRCPVHGWQEQLPDNHIRYGCGKCGKKRSGQYQTRSVSEFLLQARKIHNNKYSYGELRDKDVRNCNKITVICPVHGSFSPLVGNHLQGSGCPQCANQTRGLLRRKTTDQFIAEAKKVHGDRYDYSLVDYKTGKTKVRIICSEHGEFLQSPNNHRHGQGCPTCRGSKGERRIQDYLKKAGYAYNREVTFPNLRSPNGKMLRFDFQVFTNAADYVLIEYDGPQHFYEATGIWSDASSLQQIRSYDDLKNGFCEENNILLVRLSYKDFTKLEDKLDALMDKLTIDKLFDLEMKL